MNPETSVDSLTSRLLDALDKEADHLRRVTDFLGELSRLIIKRDEAGLHALFGRVHEETLSHESSENERGRVTVLLAGAVGCAPAELTLSMLERFVPAHHLQQLRRRRKELGEVVDALRKQHYSTSMLLGEMIRINRSLLAGLTGSSSGVTYGRGGRAKWAGTNNILNLRY
ncbi:MAG TPA: flagellar export chaperone FlgN [Sedimentisphaerales bacterium]|nr:flagellar export chaperone FlgN [Sedimentisphaerales bacterium]